MKKNKHAFDLDPERLATTDEDGHRVYLYPEDVKGYWKTRRTIVYWILIAIYLIAPWIYVGGKPSLMIDIANGEFTFLGQTLYGIEPILFFIIVAAGFFFLAFATSLFGRVWCGWACPQTVFIQTIFMKIESFVEGTARQRRAADKKGLSFEVILRRTIKWVIFLVISLHISHTFIGYFVGPKELLAITTGNPMDHFGLFSATMIITTIILLDFGWFREQFCIIACPYGRMQSVAMDENSLIVSYDVKRGEPRRGTEGVIRSDEGDCVNCYACVKVCPTGIDIRRGTQLECIACTQCIDACDDIMDRIKKPRGLIKYSSENEINGKERKVITFRSAAYAVVSLLLVGSFFFFLNASTKLDLVFLRSKTPFQVTNSGETIVNHFTLKVSHQGGAVYKVRFKIQDPDTAKLVEIVTPVSPTVINSANKKIVLFFKFPPTLLESGLKKINVDVENIETNEVISSKEVTLVGPTN